jgi:hypothetical protein
LFDFASIDGTERPLFLRALLVEQTHPSEFFEARVGIPLSYGPTTIAMPFSRFSFRGGGPGAPDFTTVTGVSFDFFFLGASEDIHWSVALGRIRFGRIPEPRSVWLLMSALIFTGRRVSGRKRQCNGDFEADFDRDGDVDGADLAIWQANNGLSH